MEFTQEDIVHMFSLYDCNLGESIRTRMNFTDNHI
jgi:hypothetical protein